MAATAGFGPGVPLSDDEENLPLVAYEADHTSSSPSSAASRISTDSGFYPSPGGESPPREAPTKLTRLNGFALVLSLQIGSGIFTVPSQVAQHVPSPGWGVAVWLSAGLLVWTGAASFAELGARIPRNGGIQEYLRAAYGDFAGFFFTWTWVVVAKPAANAAIATIAAHYLARGLLGGRSEIGSEWVARGLAALCVVGITTLNCLGATMGAKAANVFLFLKLGALTSIVVIGFLGWVLGDAAGVPSSPTGWFGVTPELNDLSLWGWIGNFVTAVFGALFCYGGWETVGFVAGDMENPVADIPAVITGAMVTVITGFCLMNAALFVCLPIDLIRASNTVAVEFARRALGTVGGLAFSFIVAVSALGALNSNVFALAKICVAASQREYFPSLLANLHCANAEEEAGYLDQKLWVLPAAARAVAVGFSDLTQRLRWQRSIPIYALILNSSATIFYVFTGSFSWLMTLIGLAEFLHFLLSVVGLLLIRRREPSAMYTTWIGNPLIFSFICSLLLIRGVINEPLQGAVIAAVDLVGFGVFSLKFGLRGFSKPTADATPF